MFPCFRRPSPRRTLFLTAVIVGSLLSAAHVWAQAPAQFSPPKLKAAAEAYLRVMEIQEKFTPLIERAQTPQEAQQHQTSANQEMVEAIERVENINVEEYSEIVTVAQQDESFREEFVAIVQEVQREELEKQRELDVPER